MAFENEYISDSDIEEYGIAEIDKNYGKGHYKPDWTIDRARRIYLRYFRSDRENHSNRKTFFFFWSGALMLVTVDIVEASGERNSAQSTEYKFFDAEIPDSLLQYRAGILADLKDALAAWKGGGIYSTATSYTAKFNF